MHISQIWLIFTLAALLFSVTLAQATDDAKRASALPASSTFLASSISPGPEGGRPQERPRLGERIANRRQQNANAAADGQTGSSGPPQGIGRSGGLIDRVRRRIAEDPDARLLPRMGEAMNRNARDPESADEWGQAANSLGGNGGIAPIDFEETLPPLPAGALNPATRPIPRVFPSPQIVSSEAIVGQPYNVGHIVFRLAPEDNERWQSRAVFVSDSQNRVFYPAIMPTFIERVSDQFADNVSQQPREIDIWFVFVGRQPLDVTIHAAQVHRVVIEPVTVRRLRQRLVTQTWWRQFNAMLDQQTAASDYPPLVQAYLTCMVQQRLGLQAPLLKQATTPTTDPMTQTWNLLTGAESLQVESLRESMCGEFPPGQVASLPLPPNVPWQDHRFEKIDPQVQIEPIAQVVPHECFYLRFGNWGNQIWLKNLLLEHGGDLGRMVRLRGYESMVGDLFRDQLALESGKLDDLFGGTLIEDVAVIGLDTFFSDGAAAGIILQAKNGLLESQLKGKRQDYAKQNAAAGVTLTDIQVGQKTGTILQTPNGQVRSILVSAGDFHLVTTSLVLAERFLEATAGIRTLGQSPEFQNARTEMPLSRDDTIFVYFSTAFLENLISPQYQIELRRRLHSITEMQMLQMAAWSASAHQVPIPENLPDWELVPLPQRIAALQEAGFLPNGFNSRADNSQIALLESSTLKVAPTDQIPARPPAADRSRKRPPATDAPSELLPVPLPMENRTDEGSPAVPLILEGPQGQGQKADSPQTQDPVTGQDSIAATSGSASALTSMFGGLLGGKTPGDAKAAGETPNRAAQESQTAPGDVARASFLSPSPNSRSGSPAPANAAAAAAAAPLPMWEQAPLGPFLYGDSLRGIRGWMIPVADTPVLAVTEAEDQWYRQRAQYFAENWAQTDPIMIGIKRFALDDSRERVVFDGRVAPFGSQRYAWLTENIGPPLYMRPATSPDDVIRLEASIAPGTMLPGVNAHQLFAAVQRDATHLQTLDPGEWWTTLKLVQDTPGYIGSWPTAGVLDYLPMLGGRPDAEGFTHSIGRKVWRMQHNGFSVIATDRDRLQRLRPNLELVEAERPSQLRLAISDLAETQLATWVNTLWRQRSWQASVANTRLLHLLMQHFRLAPDQAKQKAQSLLNAKLVCSLDGQYLIRGTAGPAPTSDPAGGTFFDEKQPWSDPGQMAMQQDPLSFHWFSDHWPNNNQQAAEDWAQDQSPLLKWFRGALLEVVQEDQRFLVHGYLDIDREAKETASLPGFNLFQGFSFK